MSGDNSTDTEEKGSMVGQLVRIGQQLGALIVFIVVIGFWVSFNIQRHNTSLFSFAVYPQEYLVWGGSFILYFVESLFLVGVWLIIGAIVFQLLRPPKDKKRFDLIGSIERTFNGLWRFISSKSGRYLLLAGLIWAVLSPNLFFQLFPISNTSTSTIRLIFKDNIDPSVWHLSTDPNQPKDTQPLFLLNEDSDGLVVKDTLNGVVVKVKNEMIAGIIDNNSLQALVSATAVPSSPTAAATATP